MPRFSSIRDEVPASVNRYLLPGERQVITIRQHPAVLLGRALLVLAGLAIAGWLQQLCQQRHRQARDLDLVGDPRAVARGEGLELGRLLLRPHVEEDNARPRRHPPKGELHSRRQGDGRRVPAVANGAAARLRRARSDDTGTGRGAAPYQVPPLRRAVYLEVCGMLFRDAGKPDDTREPNGGVPSARWRSRQPPASARTAGRGSCKARRARAALAHEPPLRAAGGASPATRTTG